VEPVRLRYARAYNKARISSETNQELSIENLEREMVRFKIDHENFDPSLLEEQSRAGIIAILSKEQDVKDHERAVEQSK